MSTPDQRRQAERIQPFVVPCRYAVGESRVPGFLTNISTLGALVRTDAEPPAVGAALQLEVRLRAQATHISVPATVRWTRPHERGGHVFGCRFEAVGEEARKVLDEVVADFRRRAAALA
jgi:hypothetical protein